jgi:hypothetical protein
MNRRRTVANKLADPLAWTIFKLSKGETNMSTNNHGMTKSARATRIDQLCAGHKNAPDYSLNVLAAQQAVAAHLKSIEENDMSRKPNYYTAKVDNTLQFVVVAIAIIGIGATVCGILMNNAGLL